jgi:hypothetical protein
MAALRGMVVIESHGLLHARLNASLAGADRGLEFLSGYQLDHESAAYIPAKMIGRLLDDGDLRKLHQRLIKKYLLFPYLILLAQTEEWEYRIFR